MIRRIVFVTTRFGNQSRSPPVVTNDRPKSHRWTTKVASASFAVATGSPPVAYGGNILCCIQNIAKIVTRTSNIFVVSPGFTSARLAFVFCLLCHSYIGSVALPTTQVAYTRCQIVFIVADVSFGNFK